MRLPVTACSSRIEIAMPTIMAMKAGNALRVLSSSATAASGIFIQSMDD